jgi:hypothetical protein
LRLIVSSLLVSAFAAAMPARAVETFVYDSTIDLTSIGGASETPFRMTYRFPTNVPPYFTDFEESRYRPLDVEMRIGTAIIRSSLPTHVIAVFNRDPGAGSLVDLYVVRGGAEGDVLGHQLKHFRVTVYDSNATMFSSKALPSSPDFARGANANVRLDFEPPPGSTTPLLSNTFGRPFTLRRAPLTCLSTATTARELDAEVSALTTSPTLKLSLRSMLKSVVLALDAGKVPLARRHMGTFMNAVVKASADPVDAPGRIPPYQAGDLLCSASNVMLNIAP